jgi:hypothetical protein
MAQGEHLKQREAGGDGYKGEHGYMIGVCALQR